LENEFETQKFVGGQRRGAAVFSAVAGAFGRSFFWTKRPVAFNI
jgi:hypothetical protein